MNAKIINIMQAAKDLRASYSNGYKFPAWSIDPKIWSQLKFGKSMVLYDARADLKVIKALATQREPTNIAMNRLYDKKSLKAKFGWSEGIYGKLTPSVRKKSNIAIYVQTPIKLSKGKFKQIHLINLVGYAFDSGNQPDFRDFTHSDGSVDCKRLVKAYQRVWYYAFYCCQQLGLKYLRLFKVGGGVFAPDFVDYDREIFKPSFISIAKMFPRITVEYNENFRVPASLDNISQSKLDETLFINAWDPWSVVGNGNGHDNSLDGWWGRSTAAAVLSWPLSNPKIKYVPVTIPDGK